ncbi:MAG: TlyA family RNA methyltransferase [Methylocystaceae bacterium]
MAEKDRLDNILVNRGITESRERARGIILAGKILVNEKHCDKPGTKFSPDVVIRCLGNDLPYVSRGGLKLEKAVQIFNLKLQDKKVLDIGASTGGFTDCALQNGAAHVIALDVGYGQLAWKLRNDPRVRVIERTNIRYFNREQLPELVDIITCDVSFISLSLVLPVIPGLLKPGGEAVLLIKPQFEAGKERVGKRGVVKDPEVHFEVINKVLAGAAEQGLSAQGLSYSPIKGPEGNIEYLLYLLYTEPKGLIGENEVKQTINQAIFDLG